MAHNEIYGKLGTWDGTWRPIMGADTRDLRDPEKLGTILLITPRPKRVKLSQFAARLESAR